MSGSGNGGNGIGNSHCYLTRQTAQEVTARGDIYIIYIPAVTDEAARFSLGHNRGQADDLAQDGRKRGGNDGKDRQAGSSAGNDYPPSGRDARHGRARQQVPDRKGTALLDTMCLLRPAENFTALNFCIYRDLKNRRKSLAAWKRGSHSPLAFVTHGPS